MQHLCAWGFSPYFSEQVSDSDLRLFTLGRVINEEKGFYRLMTEHGERLAKISGRFEFSCIEDGAVPTVGDWVLCFGDDLLLIDRLITRRSLLSRRKCGNTSESQSIAANLDLVFVVTSPSGDLNLRRIERYLALAINGGVTPVIVLSKSDLGGAAGAVDQIAQIAPGVEVISLSAKTGANMHLLLERLSGGQTAALVGSSGVGKSTILNFLMQASAQVVQEVREDDNRGRHTTTSRSMFLLPGGGILIDTPGVREVGMTESDEGVQQVFMDLDRIALSCRFSNCTHEAEPGCQIAFEVDAGRLDSARLKSWRKLQREQSRHDAAKDMRLQAEVKSDRKRRSRMVRAGQKKGIY